MATPLTASGMLVALRAEGCRVREYRDWRTNNRNHKGPWGPVYGVMIHHTVTSGTDATVRLCYEGHSSLPGPLCHTVGAKDGTLYMVGNGRANHAGSGDDDVLRAVLNEATLPADDEANTDGNRHFYGLELINLGDGKDPWPEAQVDTAARWAAGICRAHGWGAESVIGHLEWQPGKVDPRGFTMDSFRARVARILAHPPGHTSTPAQQEDDVPTAREIAEEVLTLDGIIDAPWGSPTNQTWTLRAVLTHLTKAALRTETEVKAQHATIRELAAALAARDATVDVDDLVARIQSAIESVTVRLDVPEGA